MPNPKKRHTRSRRNSRRSHDALTSPPASVCPQCSEPKRPHNVCPSCGFYKGREVINPQELD